MDYDNDTIVIDLAVKSAYDRARFQAFIYWLTNWLLRRKHNLESLDTVLANAWVTGQHALGIRTVPIDQIVGSSGRTGDFDRAFHPRRATSQERWTRIDRISNQGLPLPPVELRKVGEQYFVMDGHHRISVARQHGQHFIDAYVVEMMITHKV